MILNHICNFKKENLEKVIRDIISKNNFNNKGLYHILDICMESNMDVFNKEDLDMIIENYKLDFDIISLLIEYIEKFEKEIYKRKIYSFLDDPYPEKIKLQTLKLIAKFEGMENMISILEKSNIISSKNKVFFESYIDFLKGEFEFKKEGLLILQSMFYGDFEGSGKGNNGGLAILLKNLGDEISKDERVSYVFTITIADKLNKAFISPYADKHIFIRLPIYLNKEKSDFFVKKELYIKRSIRNFLEKIKIYPDVFHIRYLDNASKAVAKLSKELDKKLVFTLTPDPHRNMTYANGKLKKFKTNKLIENMNKIKIGDELICESSAIAGIGNKKVKKELEIYFPQLNEEDIKRKIQMIGEGIYIDFLYNEEINLNEFIEANQMDPDFFKKPIVVNVGRLAVQKGQIQLLKAWANSRLSKTHNLLFIGGDIENPTKEEKKILDFFEEFEKLHPHIRGNFFHRAAMLNEDIRSLEKSIMKNDFSYPHIYISSSIKEELGIAIIEAMSQGFLVLGPIKGGVKSYIENGVNGFLIDTRNYKTILRDIEKNIYDERITREEFREIQNLGKKTVERLFSIGKIGKEFLDFYLTLKGEWVNEI